MSRSLVKMSGKVARGTELKVALGTLVLGVSLWVLHDHRAQSRMLLLVGKGRERSYCSCCCI